LEHWRVQIWEKVRGRHKFKGRIRIQLRIRIRIKVKRLKVLEGHFGALEGPNLGKIER
jgi:hypothetical protein